MHSTIVRRLGAAISVSALALSLGTVPSSAESPQPFGATSKSTEGHRDGRVATGADLQGASVTASRSSSSAEIMATPANVVQIDARSTELHPDYKYIDIDDIWVSQSTDLDSIAGFDLRLSVAGVNKGYFPVYYDDFEEVFYVEIPGNIGLGKSRFTATRVYYTEDAELEPTIDGTDSNSFYIRRGRYEGAHATYTRSASGKTKTFKIYDMGIYSPSIDDYRALSKIKLQYKTGGVWKTKKTIYLNNAGYGSYKFVKTTKHYYRVISGKTSTWVGFKYQTPKI